MTTYQYWQHFLALESDFAATARYVEFSSDNFATFSIEYVKLLLAIGSEIDVLCKITCERIDSSARRANIDDYRACLTSHTAIASEEIVIRRYGTAFALPTAAQRSAAQVDSAGAQIRTVLRAFYFNLAHRDWQALAAYVLSPKILERRTAPGGLQTASRDRARYGGVSRATAEPVACASSTSAVVDQAAIRLDGDWAEVSVPRCSVASAGADEFRLLYLEEHWRFIYIDLFEEPTNVSTGR